MQDGGSRRTARGRGSSSPAFTGSGPPPVSPPGLCQNRPLARPERKVPAAPIRLLLSFINKKDIYIHGSGGNGDLGASRFSENFQPSHSKRSGGSVLPRQGFWWWSEAPPSGDEIFYQNTPKKTFSNWGKNSEDSGVNRSFCDIKKS